MYRGDEAKWGASLALTPATGSWTGFWHSAVGDLDPWISFEMYSHSGSLTSLMNGARIDAGISCATVERRLQSISTRNSSLVFLVDWYHLQFKSIEKILSS